MYLCLSLSIIWSLLSLLCKSIIHLEDIMLTEEVVILSGGCATDSLGIINKLLIQVWPQTHSDVHCEGNRTHTHTCCLHRAPPPSCGKTRDWEALRSGIGHCLPQHRHTAHIQTVTHTHEVNTTKQMPLLRTKNLLFNAVLKDRTGLILYFSYYQKSHRRDQSPQHVCPSVALSLKPNCSFCKHKSLKQGCKYIASWKWN